MKEFYVQEKMMLIIRSEIHVTLEISAIVNFSNNSISTSFQVSLGMIFLWIFNKLPVTIFEHIFFSIMNGIRE